MKRLPLINQANQFTQILTHLEWGNVQDPAVAMAPVTDAMHDVHSSVTLPHEPDFDVLLFENSIGDTNNVLDEVNTDSAFTVTANVPVIAEFTSHDLDNSLSSAHVLGDEHVEDDFLDLDSNSIVSFSDTATASSSDDKENECSRRLYLWSTRFPISRVAKNDLLALLRDVAFPNLPLDWRTLEKRQKADMLLSKEFSQKSLVHDYVVAVCGNCFLFRFNLGLISLATPCSHCNVSTINCGLANCSYPCVIVESLGQRSMNTLESCPMCLVNSDSKPTVRAYGYRVAAFLQRTFADRRAAMALLYPFLNHFSYHPDTFSLTSSPDWYTNWVSSIAEMPFKSELFHGRRMYNNEIWKSASGMRSIVLALSIDWFPPFKSQEYSVGVVSVIPANLSVTDRANVSNLWPVLIIEGPKEPLHTLFLLEELCTEINNLEVDGLVVFDSLTNTNLTVHVTLGPVIADTPANAKIGDHTAHTGYYACISCRYRGGLCGCKSRPLEQPPARYDNYYYGGGPRAVTAGTPRAKRKGEHIVWTDGDLIIDRHMRDNDEHRKNQVTVMRKRLSQPLVKAQYDRLRKLLLVNALSPLALILSFQFTHSFVVESMHVVLKGVVLTQLKLTLDKTYKLRPWCIYNTPGATKQLTKRLKCFKFPMGHNQPYQVVERFKRLKCAEILDFLRVCTATVFHGLISADAAACWWSMSQLYCGLLHTHVNSDWVRNQSRLADFVKMAFLQYQTVYSACHMPSNFHRVLHCRMDYNDWGPMRSHWAFPFERLYQSVMRAASHCNRKHVVKSVVNTLSNVNRLSTESDAAGRRKYLTGKPIPEMSPEVAAMLQTGWRNVATHTDKYGSMWKQGDDVFFLLNGAGPCDDNCCRLVAILQTSDKRRACAVLRFMAVEWVNVFPSYHFSYDLQTVELKVPMFIANFDRDGLNYAIVQVAKYVDHDIFAPTVGARNVIIPFCGPLPY